MLEKLLTLLQDSQTYSLSHLAHALDTSPEMIETMLQALERMGYVRQVTGCDSSCQGCTMKTSCTPASAARIWALVEHYRITGDCDWLASIYPSIQRKAEWIFRMRRATEPIQLVPDTPMLPFMNAARFAGTICVAAKDGLIQGMMDHGIDYALGWVNQWALCGLAQAAYAAEQLDQESDAARYRREADELRAALKAYGAQNPAIFDLVRSGLNFRALPAAPG